MSSVCVPCISRWHRSLGTEAELFLSTDAYFKKLSFGSLAIFNSGPKLHGYLSNLLSCCHLSWSELSSKASLFVKGDSCLSIGSTCGCGHKCYNKYNKPLWQLSRQHSTVNSCLCTDSSIVVDAVDKQEVNVSLCFRNRNKRWKRAIFITGDRIYGIQCSLQNSEITVSYLHMIIFFNCS